jgi:hypothetical protein
MMMAACQACFLAGAFPEVAQEALHPGWPEVLVDLGHVVNVVNEQYAA